MCKRARKTSATLHGSARRQWNSSQWNTRAIDVAEMIASETREQQASKWNRASYWGELTSAKHKISEVEALIGTKTNIFQKSASTTLRCFTGYHFNEHKSHHCSGSTPFQTLSEKPCTGNHRSDRSVGKQNISANLPASVVLGARFRTSFPTSRRSAALMTVVCTAQTPSNKDCPCIDLFFHCISLFFRVIS